MTALASMHGVSVSMKGRKILSGLDFAIASGESVTIIGPNGSGKSTFLRCLIKSIKPETGQVAWDKNTRIGYVPQYLPLDQSMPLRVAQFVNLGHKRNNAHELLERTGIAQCADRPMRDLSVGQFQRTLLARALADEPNLLVLDEPTLGMDQPAIAAFYELIAKVNAQQGCAILQASHDLHVVMSTSDRVICLNGHICCQGSPNIVRDAPEYRALFGIGTHGMMALYRHEHDHHHDHHHDEKQS